MKVPKKINLANIPTPLHEINFNHKKFLMKRDDLTGLELSGNKVRKLEYLMSQAKLEKADFVFTSGGEQSNHARATAVAAAMLGMKSELFLRGKNKLSANGNLFIDKFLGAEIRFLTKKENVRVNDIMFQEREKLLREGKKVYVIPEGGSTTLGIWGYINFIEELSRQIDINKISGVLTAAGSGGTSAGLLIGAALKKLNLKIYAVNVLYEADEIKKKILNLAEGCKLQFNLNIQIQENDLIILDGFSTEGYENISKDKIKLLKKFARQTGIILDPAYTGKAFKAFYDNFLSAGSNRKVLFVHTGGIFGVFGKRQQYLNA